MIRRFLRWLLGSNPGQTFFLSSRPITASDLGRMGNAAQKAARQSKMDAKHAQLRAEMGVKS